MKLLSATYSTNFDNGSAIINLFGIGGQRKVIHNFKPYFICQFNSHISEPIAKQLLRKNGFFDIQTIYRFEPIGYQTEKKMMFRVALSHPKEIKDARQIASKIPNMYKLYESDVLYVNRFLIDNDLGGFCDIQTNDNRDNNESFRLSYMGFDIECLVPVDGTFPKAESDPIIIISLSFDDNKRTVITTKESTYRGCEVIYCKTERDLIEMFISIIKVNDPDIIGGFNSNNFDFNYIATRCKILGLRPNIGRDNSDWWIRNKPDGSSDVLINGRVVVDLLPLIRRNYSLSSYNLRTVASLVGLPKLDVSPSEMRKAYLSDDIAAWDEVVAYADRDAELVMHLLIDLKIIDKYIALSKASGAMLQDILNGGQTVLIDSLMFREFKKHNRIMNNRPVIDEDDNEVGYEGAIVISPETGLHEDIIIMDFTSLYTSIMRAYNICPSTIIYDVKSTDFIESPIGAKFVKSEIGIVPNILEFLFNERIRYKKLMKSTTDKRQYEEYDNYQYAFKILLNSIYGYFGYKRSRLYDENIASSVTAFGRSAISITKETIENTIYDNIHFKVIGGDTDSCFYKPINIKIDINTAKSVASIINKELKTKLPPPMNLDFEAYGERGIFLAKKRYAVRILNNDGTYKLKMRGIETRRRDFTQYTVNTLEKILDILLSTGDIKEAAIFANAQLNRIKKLSNVNDDIDLMKQLLMTRKLTKPMSEYHGVMPHVNAIKRSIQRGEESPNIGDRIPFYIIDGKSKKISDLSELEDYVISNNINISKKYYINKQLNPPIKRIFDVLNFNIEKMKFNSRQTTLF